MYKVVRTRRSPAAGLLRCLPAQSDGRHIAAGARTAPLERVTAFLTAVPSANNVPDCRCLKA